MDLSEADDRRIVRKDVVAGAAYRQEQTRSTRAHIEGELKAWCTREVYGRFQASVNGWTVVVENSPPTGLVHSGKLEDILHRFFVSDDSGNTEEMTMEEVVEKVQSMPDVTPLSFEARKRPESKRPPGSNQGQRRPKKIARYRG